MFNSSKFLIAAAGALTLALPAALAQSGHEGHDHGPVSAGQAAVPSPAPKVGPLFSDDEFRTIANTLSGYWKAAIPGSGEIVIGVGPVSIQGMTDTLYTELARADAPNRPFRQAIWQLHRVDGKVHLRTLEFLTKADHVGGLWAAPEVFPPMNAQQFKETLDIAFTKEGATYKGLSPKRFPSTFGGATEIAGQMSFDVNTIVTADRGYKADGTLAWGPKEGESYTFKRENAAPRALHLEGGVVVIDYPNAQQAEAAKPGDRVTLHYIGYLENGKMFDASHERGMPFTYTKGSPMLEGWNRAMSDARRGMVRRIYIPAALAHGAETSNNRVPANSNVFYDVRILDVAAAPTVVSAPGAVPPSLQPVDRNDPVVKKIEAQMEAKRKADEEKKKQADPATPVAPK